MEDRRVTFLIWPAVGKEKPAKRILGPFQQKKDESDPGCIDDNDERL